MIYDRSYLYDSYLQDIVYLQYLFSNKLILHI